MKKNVFRNFARWLFGVYHATVEALKIDGFYLFTHSVLVLKHHEN
jgi:hypothetical protein